MDFFSFNRKPCIYYPRGQVYENRQLQYSFLIQMLHNLKEVRRTMKLRKVEV